MSHCRCFSWAYKHSHAAASTLCYTSPRWTAGRATPSYFQFAQIVPFDSSLPKNQRDILMLSIAQTCSFVFRERFFSPVMFSRSHVDLTLGVTDLGAFTFAVDLWIVTNNRVQQAANDRPVCFITVMWQQWEKGGESVQPKGLLSFLAAHYVICSQAEILLWGHGPMTSWVSCWSEYFG